MYGKKIGLSITGIVAILVFFGCSTTGRPSLDWKPDISQEDRVRGWTIVLPNRTDLIYGLQELRVDLGLAEKDTVPVGIFSISDSEVFNITVEGNMAVEIFVDEEGWLIRGNRVVVEKKTFGKFWLVINSADNEPGDYTITAEIVDTNGISAKLTITVHVWDVSLPEQNNFGMMMYAYMSRLSHHFQDEADYSRFAEYMSHLQELRVTNCDWEIGPHVAAKYLVVSETGESLSEWSARQVRPVDVLKLPDVDFSHYDCIFEQAISKGITRFNAIVRLKTGPIARLVLGRSAEPESYEGWELICWFYRQLKRYAAQKGFTDFWMKIGDEIWPSEIKIWIKRAKCFREMGYKTYTTNTNRIPRSKRLIGIMNPVSDAWHVQLMYTSDFSRLTQGNQPSIQLDTDDELWFYGGGGGYRTPYKTARSYGWKMCAFDLDGYGFWTYLRNDGKNMLVRYNSQTRELIRTAAVEGIRDGNEDAAYFMALKEKYQKTGNTQGIRSLYAKCFTSENDAFLEMDWIRKKIWKWYDFTTANTYVEFNRSKQEVLRLLE